MSKPVLNPKSPRNSLKVDSRSPLELKALSVWRGQRKREGVLYPAAAFMAWYVREYRKKKKWKRAHVARKDHSKPYSFDNVELQEQAENNRERNARRGNPTRRWPVTATHIKTGEVKEFTSMKAAAEYYKINRKTVWNHCVGNTTRIGVLGPLCGRVGVRFKWV